VRAINYKAARLAGPWRPCHDFSPPSRRRFIAI